MLGEEFKIEAVVEIAVAGGDDRAVVAHVLGVGQDEVVAELLERLAQGVALAVESPREKRLAPSMTTFRCGQASSSISRRQATAESTTLLAERVVLLGELGADAQDVPAQEAREVDEVARLPEQVVPATVGLGFALGSNPGAAGLHQWLQGVRHLVAIGRVAVPRAHGEDLADLLADELTREGDAGSNRRIVPTWDEPGGGDRSGEGLALLDVDAHRLLHEHVLSGIERLERHRHVELVRDRHDHRSTCGSASISS